MLCPVCKVELKLAERQGIEIDYCPKCRGVWLDRSELDEIIKKSNAENTQAFDEEDEDDDRSSGRGRRGGRRNRDDEDDEEGGFLGNLFGGFGGRDD